MISFKYKCIFIEVPKTGSSSIRKIIGHPQIPHLDINEMEMKVKNSLPWDSKGYNILNSFYKKGFPENLKLKIGGKILETYFKFGFVRNPWSRVVSLYNRKEGIQMQESMSFSEFVNWIEYSSDTCIHPSQKKSQLDWFKLENGKIKVDYIGKFENLNKDWEYISNQLGINERLPHINKNHSIRKLNYREYYDDKTRDVIARKFKEDIDYFNYEF